MDKMEQHRTDTSEFPETETPAIHLAFCSLLVNRQVVVLSLLFHNPSLDVLGHFRRYAVQECLIFTNQSHCVARLSPPGVAANLDSLWLDLLGKFGQVGGHGTLWQGR